MFSKVAFIAGILTGVSLTIAGSVLRGKRGGDLLVLVYIGCLTTMVCALLLSVQCCVGRNVERRKRARRAPLGVAIPLQDMGHVDPMPLAPPRLPPAPGQYEPLLRRLVQQQIQQTHPTVTVVRWGDEPVLVWYFRFGDPVNKHLICVN